MARKLRIEFPGAIYHVLSRGDRRENIFRDDIDRKRFLETLGETCAKTGWQIHAYCLMSNHFHIVIESPQPNLVAGMKWFLGTYTMRFNRRHKVTGHLFSGRYKSQIVSGNGGYLRTVCDYVHLNPVRARLLPAARPLRDFRWSSLPAYLLAAERPAWLRLDRMFGECGIQKDSAPGRTQFERRLEARRTGEDPNNASPFSHDWCLGDEQFKTDLLAKIGDLARAWHYGNEVHELVEVKAGRIVTEELQRLGWSEETLGRLRKGDRSKIDIARRLRTETTMTMKWIAERLRMGTRTHLTHLLYWQKRLKQVKKAGGKTRIPTIPLTDPTPRIPTIPLTDPANASFDPAFD